MHGERRSIAGIALFVALGGFLMGFDASVISGVVGFVRAEFGLSTLQLGWAVASLTLAASLAMLAAGPLADRIGRRPVLQIAAALFAVSAVLSAIAPNYAVLVAARMLGGLGVGAALIIAPMYIAEIAPAGQRGRLVSFNQLNIVIGISAAFFSNYLLLLAGDSGAAWAEALRLGDWNWRWMLGVEALPALVYLLALLAVPESPRWLSMRGRNEEARAVFAAINGEEAADAVLADVRRSLTAGQGVRESSIRELFSPALRLALTIGLGVAVLQQITGINAVFFYAPMIFEQSGIGRDAAFMQAVLVGLVNLAFTVVAMLLIDRLGRRPLLGIGLAGIAVCMLTLAFAFGSATYTLSPASIGQLPEALDRDLLLPLAGVAHASDVAFREAVSALLGAENFAQYQSQLVAAAIDIDGRLVLAAILGFVASFAVSLGPVMWVLFSELFPNRLRGLAVSVAGLVNSAVSFGVQFVFPWELEQLGASLTFLLFGSFALVGLFFVLALLPETRGRSLEDLERLLRRD